MASHKDHDNKFYMSISQGDDNHPFDYFRALYGKFRDYRVQTIGEENNLFFYLLLS